MVQFSRASAVEKIYEAVFAVEDALALESETNTDYDRGLLHEKRKEAAALLKRELLLDAPFEELNSE